MSEDPAFLDLAANDKVEILLVDPQSLNSYSYVKNNPLAYIDPTGEGAIRAYFASWASGLSAAASTLRGPLGSYIGPFGPTGNKVFNEIQASNMSDLSTAINPDSSVKDRAISGGLIALNFVPIGEEAGASEKVAVEMVPKIAKTAEEWGAIAFDAGKQQAKMLRGVANQAVHGLVTKTFQLTDGIIGGTSAAAKYTYETGNLVRGYDHFKKNWNIMKEGMNILQSEVLNSQELKTVKNIINRAWRTNYK